MLKSRVFLSYTSSLGETAARVELSLKGEGFSVFRDRSALPPGESFDDRIRAAIEESDLFVFLVTPEAVAPGRYTLTELKFAEQKWPHPGGRVLPVVVEETPKEAIPAYLRAVTILKPRGNLVAEVAAEVARMGAPWWRRMLEPRRLVPAVVVALLVAGGAWLALPPYLERQEQNARAAALVKQSRSMADAGDAANAWKLLQQATEVAPASREVFEAQEQLAMNLLRHAGVNYPGGSGAFVEDLLTRTSPVLSRGTSGAKGERLANLLAHMGWADYLRERTGVGGLDPAQRYRSALEADPGNVYAHAMWGFELLRKRRTPEALAEANEHFSAARQTGREREYLRTLQVSALLRTYSNVWIEEPERQEEVMRIANKMRTGGEPQPKGWGPGSFKRKVWAIYHFRFVASEAQEPILAALPAAEHLATFRWLFPEEDLAQDEGGPSLFDYFTVRAQVEERAGERAGALASYRRVLGEFESRKLDGGRAIKTADKARAAIRRLGG
ncbi:MAG: toll/interleukin-1 receptor domain-containing protein [Betaproteobacteria bacterium]|nr:toll/interleukin-1 receptor domain-containing protein [Betaproteobacteria bacterium]